MESVPPILMRAGVALAAAKTTASTLSFRVGGAQDSASFFDNIQEGFLPRLSSVQIEGLLNQHTFDTTFRDVRGEPEASPPESHPPSGLLFPRYSVLVDVSGAEAVSAGNATRPGATVHVAVGLDSNIDSGSWVRPPLDAVFVLDVSGSMKSPMSGPTAYYYGNSGSAASGERFQSKLSAGQQLLCHMLAARLRRGDTASVVSFHTAVAVTVELFQPTGGEPSPGSKDACAAVMSLSASGGTNLDAAYTTAQDVMRAQSRLADPAVAAASETLASPPRARRIYILTDEQPNIFRGQDTQLRQWITEAATDPVAPVYTTVIGLGLDFNPDIAASLGAIPGFASHSVHTVPHFKKLLDEDFDFGVLPILSKFRMRWEPATAGGTGSTGEPPMLPVTVRRGWGMPGGPPDAPAIALGEAPEKLADPSRWAAVPEALPGFELMSIASLYGSRKDAESGESKGGVLLFQLVPGTPTVSTPSDPNAFVAKVLAQAVEESSHSPLGVLVVSYVEGTAGREVTLYHEIVAGRQARAALGAATAGRVRGNKAVPPLPMCSHAAINIAFERAGGDVAVAAPLVRPGPSALSASTWAGDSLSARRALWLVQFGSLVRAWVAVERLRVGAVPRRGYYVQTAVPLSLCAARCDALMCVVTQLRVGAALLQRGNEPEGPSTNYFEKELAVLSVLTSKCDVPAN